MTDQENGERDMKLVVTILATAAILAPISATATDAGTYWDSVLARAVLDNVQPCDVALQDARDGRAPYIDAETLARATPPELGMIGEVLCARNLGPWTEDPGQLWLDSRMRRAPKP